MSLKYSYHFLSTHLAPGFNTASLFLQQVYSNRKNILLLIDQLFQYNMVPENFFSTIFDGHMEKTYTKKAEIHI